MKEWLYVGTRPELANKRALARDGDDEKIILVRFHDVKTELGYGWHAFPRSDFRELGEDE